MRRATITTAWYIVMLFFLLQGCAALFRSDEEWHREQKAQFEPFRQKNTIPAYQEFIQKYPDNIFVNLAKGSIENLKYAPYEQKDTIEGYRDFLKTFPTNPNRSRAAARIEQLEFKQIEDADTIAAYRDFLQKHSSSNYTMLAQQRLQDLEFRALDQKCQEQYRFDLMLYRLNVSRLQKELESTNAGNLGDFTLFASVDTYKNNRCFHTHLIYGDAIGQLDTNKKEASEPFFDSVIAKLLVYLDQKFTSKKALDGFCFTIASSANRFYGDATVLLAYYFPAESVHQFAQGELKPRELLSQATVSIPAHTTPAEKASFKQPALPAEKKDERK